MTMFNEPKVTIDEARGNWGAIAFRMLLAVGMSAFSAVGIWISPIAFGFVALASMGRCVMGLRFLSGHHPQKTRRVEMGLFWPVLAADVITAVLVTIGLKGVQRAFILAGIAIYCVCVYVYMLRGASPNPSSVARRGSLRSNARIQA